MYQVIAFADEGIEVQEFERLDSAERDAEAWREAGARAVLCQVLREFDPDDGPWDEAARVNGVRPGVDFPGSLGWGR